MIAIRPSEFRRRLSRPGAAPWVGLIVTWLVLSLLAMAGAGEVARRGGLADLRRQAEANAVLHAAVLRSELEKQRSIPVVLAQDPEIQALMAEAGSDRADRVSARLAALALQTRAAAIYVLDEAGLAVAASNWREPTSFVGSNYAFRPYFTGALDRGNAEFFALGTVSGRPGLYLARRIGTAATPLGVVVVKVEFNALEADWRGTGEPAFVTDARGVVLVTSEPEWRFRRTRLLTAAERRDILADQTLGGQDLSPLPFDKSAGTMVRLADGAVRGEWMLAQAPTDTPGWTLWLLDPVDRAMDRSINNARIIALLLVTLAATAAGVMLRRRQQATARAAADEAARTELERRIDERTLELRDANSRLSSEIEERRRSEASREVLREELFRASRLATLGQIAAGVAHEINQPVAAIRTHADSAVAYIERGDAEGAARNLVRVADLTGRIGTITDELRAFSRKASQTVSPVSAVAAIDGALLLVGHRLRDNGVRLERRGAEEARVMADPVRLEQVVVNLVQNAFEAMMEEAVADPTLTIEVIPDGTHVDIVIADNGPGIDPAVAATLFTPFVTTKEQGLGLGLVICRDIVAGFGGELTVKALDPGAAFVIKLKVAP